MSDYERDDFEITPELLANFSSEDTDAFFVSYDDTAFDDCEPEEKSIEQIREERFRRQEQRKINRRKERRSALVNYLMPTMALVLLVSTVCYMNSLRFGLVVTYNNENLGVVENAAVVEEATQIIDSRIINKSLDSLENEPQYRVAVISNNSEFQNSTELSRSIIANDSSLEDELCGVFADDDFIGSLTMQEDAQEVLDELLAAKKKEAASLGDVQKVEFNTNVTIEVGLYAADSVIDKAELKQRLENNVDLSYKVTVLEQQNVKIKYKTEYVADSTKPSGYEKVTVKGQIGEGIATNESVYIDGEKISSEHKKVAATKKPVNEVITVSSDNEHVLQKQSDSDTSGSTENKDSEKPAESDSDTDSDKRSEEKPAAESSEQSAQEQTAAPEKTSQFIWPVQGYVTGVFGYEGEHFHKGMDIGAGNGTPIAAAASGTVVNVVYDYSTEGLGCYVTVDHGDGYQTTYAQCSDIYAAIGQHVEQGEIIAAVGSTGDSTGPHLHFRITQYGEFLDPANFLY